jgi:hypothetical protein
MMPWLEGADRVDASLDEGGLASPTSNPPETMTISKPTATSAFLERMLRVKGDPT